MTAKRPLVRRSHKPKRSLRPKANPRQLVTETVRAYTSRKNRIRITFSADVIKKLIDIHMDIFREHYLVPVHPKQRLRQFRLQFARLADIGIPAVFVRIEPPTFDPHGKRIHRVYRNQFYAEIVASKLRMRCPIPARKLELLWADQGNPYGLNGLILTFPDEDMVPFDPTLPPKSSGVRDDTLQVY